MDNIRKRRIHDGNTANGAGKRIRSDNSTEFQPFTSDQLRIVSQAASILGVSFEQLSAIGRREEFPDIQGFSNAISVYPPYSGLNFPPFETMESGGQNLDPSLKEKAGISMSEEETDSSLFVDKILWGVSPPKWADCFSSLLPQTQDCQDWQTGNCFGSTPASYGTSNPIYSDPRPSTYEAMIPYSDKPPALEYAIHESPQPHTFACDSYIDPKWETQYSLSGSGAQMSFQEFQQPSKVHTMIYPSGDNFPSPSFRNRSIPSTVEEISLLANGENERKAPLDTKTDSFEDVKTKEINFVKEHGRLRRGPFRTNEEREQTAQTRRDKACFRCRMQRIRCCPDPQNPQGQCLTCKSIASPKVTKSVQCFRWKITDTKLFKLGQVPGLEWTSRWSDKLDRISQWASQETKTLSVTEGYCSDVVDLEVAEFVPVAGDMLSRNWMAGGLMKSVTIPPYAVFKLSKAKTAYETYINESGPKFFQGALNRQESLLWLTYVAAIEASNDISLDEENRKLIKMVLRLWVATRINTTSTYIVSDETLGMPKDLLDETYPMKGRVPIPPVMGAQIELIVREIQVALRSKILNQLQKLILANKWENWLTIYLCVFVLLHNCALITQHDAGYAIKKGLKGRFARPSMVREYHLGADILLAHWHYCNKGAQIFLADIESINKFGQTAGLNSKQLLLLYKTRQLVMDKAFRFEEIRRQGLVEDHYFFVSQMYEVNWEAR